MSVKEVSEGRDEVSVATTGALYVINKSSSDGEILCYQNLEKKRLIASLRIHIPLERLTLEWKGEETCLLHQEGYLGPDATIRVNCDSVLSVSSDRGVRATYTGQIIPKYMALYLGNFISTDQEGGIGAYPLGMTGVGIPQVDVNFSEKDWQVTLSIAPHQRFLTSIFPPRPFNWEKSFMDRIVHHYSYEKPYPTDKELEEWGKYGNIMVLHETVWHGKQTRTGKVLKSIRDAYADASWNSFKFVPRNEAELRRVVESSHRFGMRLIVYMSPYYFIGELEEYLKEMSWTVKKYQLDGVYFDGISPDVWQGYQTMRKFREIMEDKTLYVHEPTAIGSRYANPVPCPFIDTYADYTLKAEHVKTFDMKYLRYFVSSFNISNSIGYLCNFDYPLTEKLIDQVLEANARLPYWCGWWMATLMSLYGWQREDLTKETLEEMRNEEKQQKTMREVYFPKLQALKKVVTKTD